MCSSDLYNRIAKHLNLIWNTGVPSEYDLAFLPIETLEAIAYMSEMDYCIKYALANRKLMMSRVLGAFEKRFSNYNWDIESDVINIAHNYAKYENHFGKNVIVHRKGATQEIGRAHV